MASKTTHDIGVENYWKRWDKKKKRDRSILKKISTFELLEELAFRKKIK